MKVTDMNIAKEPPSTKLPKPTRMRNYQWTDGSLGFECDIGPYQCCLKWNWGGAEPLVQGQSFAMIQVCRADGGSVVDWRHLQQIKNLMLDPEWEAVEIFPAESRLKDPSNARYLWASSVPFGFGMNGTRVVFDSDRAIAPQRPFEKEAP